MQSRYYRGSCSDEVLTRVHPETGDFQMLSDLAPGSVRSDAGQFHFSGALANQISTN